MVASPDEKYAIIVPGISKAPSKSLKDLFSKTEVYLLNVKTLKIKGTEKNDLNVLICQIFRLRIIFS